MANGNVNWYVNYNKQPVTHAAQHGCKEQKNAIPSECSKQRLAHLG